MSVMHAFPYPNTQLACFEPNLLGRDFAVGDIHGSFTALQQALDHIGFDTCKDRLFSVGDLVDRGPESEQVLDWLDKPWFHAICGNHDFMIWRAALDQPYAEVNYREHGGQWLDSIAPDLRQSIGEHLRALPLAMEIATPRGAVGLVHADCPYDDWQLMREQTLSAASIDCSLWSRARYLRHYTEPVRNIRAVIHGHNSVGRVQKLGNVFFIDTGGWRAGQGHFSLLELNALETHVGPGPVFIQPSRRYR